METERERWGWKTWVIASLANEIHEAYDRCADFFERIPFDSMEMSELGFGIIVCNLDDMVQVVADNIFGELAVQMHLF